MNPFRLHKSPDTLGFTLWLGFIPAMIAVEFSKSLLWMRRNYDHRDYIVFGVGVTDGKHAKTRSLIIGPLQFGWIRPKT